MSKASIARPDVYIDVYGCLQLQIVLRNQKKEEASFSCNF